MLAAADVGLGRCAVIVIAVALVASACSGGADVSGDESDSTRGDGPGREVSTESVSFVSGDLRLEGSLWLPPRSPETPAPAVVLIHGSGPQSRSSVMTGQLNMAFGFDIAVFDELAAGLRDAGIAVLTYDKRTCGPFNGCAVNDYPVPADDLVVDDFIADAAAAVSFVASRPEVDGDRIVVVGHSQGAQFVTTLLAEHPELAGGVLLAGPFDPIDQILAAQLELSVDLFELTGVPEAEALAAPALAGLVGMVEGVAAVRAGGDDPVAGAGAEFWRSWIALADDGFVAGARISQPMLVVNGDLDWNVRSIQAERWGVAGLAWESEVTVAILPCITHALNCVGESDPRLIRGTDIGEHVDQTVIDPVVAFVLAT